MKVVTKNLLDALTKVKPGLAKSEVIEQSVHFILDEQFIKTYNDEISVSQKFKTGVVGALKAHEFYELLKRIPDEEIDISQDDATVVLKGKKIKSSLNILPEIKLPELKTPGVSSSRWQVLPDGFDDAVSFCRFSTSDNMIIPALSCLWVTSDRVVSCDNYRATIKKMKKKIPEDFLLPGDPAQHLPKYNAYKYLIDGAWIHFINKENTVFSCRNLEATYPETIWEFFKVDGEEVELPDNFTDIVDRTQVLATAELDIDRFITMTISKNKLVCRGSGDLGWVQEEVKIDYSGRRDIEIKVHPELLIQILKHLKKMIIGEKLLFEGKGFQHAILLTGE